MGKLLTTTTLPVSCSRNDVVSLVENAKPTSDFVDNLNLVVASGKVQPAFLMPRWVKVGDALGFADFATAGLTNDIELFALPGGGIIEAVMIKHSESFDDGAGPMSAYTLSVGIAGTLAKYAVAFDVYQAPGDTVFQVALVPLGAGDNFAAETFNASGTSIRVAATSVGANLDQATTGICDIWVKYGVVA